MQSEPPFTAKEIAAAILKLGKPNGLVITPMKLQKLAYIAHGWFLGLGCGPLIKDSVYAWKYGPVYQEIYHAYSDCGGDEIAEVKYPKEANRVLSNANVKQHLEDILEEYGKLSGTALSALTHKPGSPWSLTYKPFFNGVVIPQQLIQSHYEAKALS